MDTKMICIAFPGGGILPAKVMKTDKDRRVGAREPVMVPEVYGKHLIHDRFAVPAEMPKPEEPKTAKKAAAAKKAADDQAAAEKKAAEDKAAEDKAVAEKKAESEKAAAEQAVLEAMAAVDKAGDDMVAKAEAEKVLKDAEAALEALKG